MIELRFKSHTEYTRMRSNPSETMNMYLVYVFHFLMFSQILQFLSAREEGKCPRSFSCGSIGMIEFPFTTRERLDCGLLDIAGCEGHDPNSLKTIKLNGKLQFMVLGGGRSSLIVRDLPLYSLLVFRNCGAFSSNVTLPPNSPLASYYVSSNVTLFRCNRSLNLRSSSNGFLRYSCPDNIDIYYDTRFPNSEKTDSSLPACSRVHLPSKDFPDDADPFTFVTSEITLEVKLSDDCDKCYHQKGGRCQLDTHNRFYCAQVGKSSKVKLQQRLALGIGGLLAVEEGKCPNSFNCGNLGKIEFPFTTTERLDCGLLDIAGCDGNDPNSPKTIKLNGKLPFSVLLVDRSSLNVLDLVLHTLLGTRNCDAFNSNFTLPPHSPMTSYYVSSNVTLFRCNRSLNLTLPSEDFLKYSCPDNIDIYYDSQLPNLPPPDSEKTDSSLSACSMVQLPRKDFPDNADPFTFVSSQITLEVRLSDDCDKCHNEEGGRCQLDSNQKFLCAQVEKKSSKVKLQLRLTLGIGGLLAVVAGGFLVKVYFLKWKKQSPTNQMIESLLKKHGSLQTKRYNYSEIKKITNSFQNRLGQGGYGSVYKGQLYDGRVVAVKVLVESKGNGEKFINEVASISHTCHVKIVTLLGFCIQGSKRALIYELMSNGSLEKFLNEENIEMLNRQLDCNTLYNIAIGVARGLDYLHRGCNTRILYFDIKPHSILLNEEFFLKISDFGLAKIYPKRESIISLTNVRGTIRYIAPEVLSRNFGGVFQKSNIYSYGILILEMVGGRKNTNFEVDCSSEIYFPHWIYKCLELNQELHLHCIKNEGDNERVKKMTVVGLWCIQIDPENQPTMNKVVEMLDGSLESLQMPPKPYISSPKTSLKHYSKTHGIPSSFNL